LRGRPHVHELPRVSRRMKAIRSTVCQGISDFRGRAGCRDANCIPRGYIRGVAENLCRRKEPLLRIEFWHSVDAMRQSCRLPEPATGSR
jgi:hypothetical protein